MVCSFGVLAGCACFSVVVVAGQRDDRYVVGFGGEEVLERRSPVADAEIVTRRQGASSHDQAIS
jgi:hypothetical protein